MASGVSRVAVVEISCCTSRTSLSNAALGKQRFVDFCCDLISRKATVPGRQRCGLRGVASDAGGLGTAGVGVIFTWGYDLFGRIFVAITYPRRLQMVKPRHHVNLSIRLVVHHRPVMRPHQGNRQRGDANHEHVRGHCVQAHTSRRRLLSAKQIPSNPERCVQVSCGLLAGKMESIGAFARSSPNRSTMSVEVLIGLGTVVAQM